MQGSSNIKSKKCNKKFHTFFSIITRQLIAVSICTSFVLGIKYCPNKSISSYADSFGYALRYNFDWKSSASSVVEKFNDIFQYNKESDAKTETQPQVQPIDTITFH